MFVHGDPDKDEILVELEFVPCQKDGECPDDWEDKIKKSDFEFNLISRRYDISDPSSPLKYKFESILVPISTHGEYVNFVNVVRNDYLINDWYSFFTGGEIKSFYSFEVGEKYYRNFEKGMLFLFQLILVL